MSTSPRFASLISGSLTWPDFLLVAACFAALFAFGLWSGRKEETTSDFFLGGRRIPAWAAMLSFVATEISAMTIIGVPATAFRENWQYLQFFAGSAASRVVIAFLFIPAFYRYDCTTIYEFLHHRFGRQTQAMASLFFFVTRLLASGVRLMAACAAVSVILHWPLIPVILIFMGVSTAYISYGGIKAVVWTNVFQAAVFLISGIATVLFLLYSIDGGFSGVLAAAGSAGRLSLVNLGPSWGEPEFLRKFFSDPNILWIALLNGFFGSMAAFGTDQELMQRLLTVETRRESQKTMLLTIAGSFIVLALYMAVGTCLFAYYAQHPALPMPARPDDIYPHFATQAMPALLRGGVLAAVIMASIDSPLASLSASFVTDLYRPLIRLNADEKHYLLVSRICVVFFGLLLAAVAYGFSYFDKMLWLAFKIGGVTYGSLLGVFLLGLLSKRRANKANVAAMAVMGLANLALLLLSELKILPLGWSWLILTGTFGTIALSWLLAPVLDKNSII
ncbi:MAG: sodium/solute symporter [Elusimicrobia bacterium]|nr:sodium/solute symporter [Elusimicrobiota bacterium]